MPFYAVAKGRRTGIYQTWEECKRQVDRFPNAVFKKFNTKDECETFISEKRTSMSKRSAEEQNVVVPVTKRARFTSDNFKSKNVPRKLIQTDYVHSQQTKTIQFNDKGDPIVYTDGACTANGRRGAQAGIGVFWADNHPDNVSRPLPGKPTNNRAEIEAAIVAIETALKNGYRTLEIRTDSQFMIDSMTKWITGWKRNGWKLSTGGPVKNKSDWIRLDSAKSRLDRLVWTKVRGHSGIYGNEQADHLATDCIKNL